MNEHQRMLYTVSQFENIELKLDSSLFVLVCFGNKRSCSGQECVICCGRKARLKVKLKTSSVKRFFFLCGELEDANTL
jgi:hypothetical protein